MMDQVGNKSKTVMTTGDFNFPFIKWPEKEIYSRNENPQNMASEKVQAKMLLDWAESNFLEQIILTATRGGNILDLVFTNSATLIDSYSTIVNKRFSDHNILKINLNYCYKN